MFEWTKDLSVKDPTLDDQHQKLLGLMSRISESTTLDTKGLRQILLELIQATQEHFFFEEEMMVAIDYSGIIEHQKIHRNLLKKLQDFSQELQKNDSAELRAHMVIFLEAWLIGHIKQIDRKYVPNIL